MLFKVVKFASHRESPEFKHFTSNIPINDAIRILKTNLNSSRSLFENDFSFFRLKISKNLKFLKLDLYKLNLYVPSFQNFYRIIKSVR